MHHPEGYNRMDIIKEIQRRGVQMLKDLGWPTNEDAIYKNKYTGDEIKLKEIQENLFSALEHWWPKEKFEGSQLLDEYKEKQANLSSF